MPKSARIPFIAFLIIITLIGYYLFAYEGEPFKIRIINNTDYDITELEFHMPTTTDTVAIMEYDSSDIYEFRDIHKWNIFVEPLMWFGPITYLDMGKKKWTDKAVGMIGKSSLKKDIINKVYISTLDTMNVKYFRFSQVQ